MQYPGQCILRSCLLSCVSCVSCSRHVMPVPEDKPSDRLSRCSMLVLQTLATRSVDQACISSGIEVTALQEILTSVYQNAAACSPATSSGLTEQVRLSQASVRLGTNYLQCPCAVSHGPCSLLRYAGSKGCCSLRLVPTQDIAVSNYSEWHESTINTVQLPLLCHVQEASTAEELCSFCLLPHCSATCCWSFPQTSSSCCCQQPFGQQAVQCYGSTPPSCCNLLFPITCWGGSWLSRWHSSQ